MRWKYCTDIQNDGSHVQIASSTNQSGSVTHTRHGSKSLEREDSSLANSQELGLLESNFERYNAKSHRMIASPSLKHFANQSPQIFEPTSMPSAVLRNSMRGDELSKLCRISGLHENGSRACTSISINTTLFITITVPVNLQTKPSPALRLLRIPPLATRSRT